MSTRRQSLQLLRELVTRVAKLDDVVFQLDLLLLQQLNETGDLPNEALGAAREVVGGVLALKKRLRDAIEQTEVTEVGWRRRQ